MTRLIFGIALLALAFPASAGEVKSIAPDELFEQLKARKEKILVLDVRTPKEYREGHVPGSVNIPYHQLESRIGDVKAHAAEKVVVYCESGGRAAKAEAMLQEAGISEIYDLDGHMKEWREQKRPTRRPRKPTPEEE